MSDDPVNLNRVRKARARAEKAARADENAVRFGRSKTEKAQERASRDQGAAHLDRHRRDHGRDHERDP